MWEQALPELASQVELHTKTRLRRKTLPNLQFLTGANVVSSVGPGHPYWKAKNLNGRVIRERPTAGVAVTAASGTKPAIHAIQSTRFWIFASRSRRFGGAELCRFVSCWRTLSTCHCPHFQRVTMLNRMTRG